MSQLPKERASRHCRRPWGRFDNLIPRWLRVAAARPPLSPCPKAGSLFLATRAFSSADRRPLRLTTLYKPSEPPRRSASRLFNAERVLLARGCSPIIALREGPSKTNFQRNRSQVWREARLPPLSSVLPRRWTELKQSKCAIRRLVFPARVRHPYDRPAAMSRRYESG